MKKRKLNLYLLDVKYVRDLASVDDKVMSISPQANKENRPFVGIVVIMGEIPYCIPLTSPKPKHNKMKNDKDFSKIYDKKNKIIGALNFNNMIPVSSDVITKINLKPQKEDSSKEKAYKQLLNNQLDWCNNNAEAIIIKANKLYRIVTETPDKMRNLTRRCCDFKKLESVLAKRKEHTLNQPNKSKSFQLSRKQMKQNADKLKSNEKLQSHKSKQHSHNNSIE